VEDFMSLVTSNPNRPPSAANSLPTNVSVAEPRRIIAVKWWATLGALILTFIAYVLIDWVSGPFFERVPTGPNDPPTFMKVAIIGFQALSIPVALGLIYWFAVRPLIRERRLPLDGMLVLAFYTLWFQDPLSAYGGHWFTYNSWAINYGAWVHSVPGWLSNGKPGAMLVEPILIMPGLYVYVFVITMFLGAWVMRRTQAKWPRVGKIGLVTACFASMVGFDIILEGVIFMPLGVWEYPGGRGFSIFPGTYHAFPVNEIITVSATFTAIACLRYFRDDKGLTLVERGSEQLRTSPVKQTLIRAFAVLAGVHVALFILYNVPNTWIGMHSKEWQQDLLNRSYFTDGLCGAHTDRACPGPGVPLSRNDNDGADRGSAYITPDGKAVIPKNAKLPNMYPFRRDGRSP
jgi:Spirocyclase AveC-like